FGRRSRILIWPGARTSSRASDRAVAVALSSVAGLVLAAGGVRHPDGPADPAEQQARVVADPLWRPSHLLLTLALTLAVPALGLGLRAAEAAGTVPAVARAGVVLLAFACGVGSLGTLVAANGLPAAAREGDDVLFRVVADLDLGMGWLCILAGAAGVGLVGFATARGTTGPLRVAASIVAVGGASYVVAAALMPPEHWWTHQYLLPSGATLLGLVLVGCALLLVRARTIS
ncbi:MAG: hypothetical protein ACT4PT_01620, partial [Methanobacteriota archaeon]